MWSSLLYNLLTFTIKSRSVWRHAGLCQREQYGGAEEPQESSQADLHCYCNICRFAFCLFLCLCICHCHCLCLEESSQADLHCYCNICRFTSCLCLCFCLCHFICLYLNSAIFAHQQTAFGQIQKTSHSRNFGFSIACLLSKVFSLIVRFKTISVKLTCLSQQTLETWRPIYGLVVTSWLSNGSLTIVMTLWSVS